MPVRALLWVGFLAWQLHAPLADARSGGSAITVPNFVNPLSSVAPTTTLGNVGQSSVGSATNNSVASGTSVNGGLVPRSTSPFVPPLVQTRPAVTTSVLTNTGNGTFTVTTVPQTFGLFTFSNGAMTPVSGNVLAPSVVLPQHDMTQAKIIVFQ